MKISAHLVAVLLLLLIEVPTAEASTNFLSQLSPKLRTFLLEHPAAKQKLEGESSNLLKRKQLKIYYFYTDDEAVPKASHYYPNASGVIIMLRENQEAIDEYICLLFEVANTSFEHRFRILQDEALSGNIDKSEFVRGVFESQLQAMQQTRKVLSEIELPKSETSKSHFYGQFTTFSGGA